MSDKKGSLEVVKEWARANVGKLAAAGIMTAVLAGDTPLSRSFEQHCVAASVPIKEGKKELKKVAEEPNFFEVIADIIGELDEHGLLLCNRKVIEHFERTNDMGNPKVAALVQKYSDVLAKRNWDELIVVGRKCRSWDEFKEKTDKISADAWERLNEISNKLREIREDTKTEEKSSKTVPPGKPVVHEEEMGI